MADADPLVEFYRCPDDFAAPRATEGMAGAPGYFRLGDDTICYGRCAIETVAHVDDSRMRDAYADLATNGSRGRLPFHPSEVLDNLRRERYVTDAYPGRRHLLFGRRVQQVYHYLRPLLPASTRRQLQRFFLRDWRSLRFPRWPVDTTVEQIQERLLLLSMRDRNVEEVPFVWFWPDGALSCLLLTHDIETGDGAAFVPRLMDIDDSYGFKAAFQFIPEKQYAAGAGLFEEVRARGFEVNVHDLRHDGNLFDDREKFLLRARSINRYLQDYGATGFRAGKMYRNVEWYDALRIEYDMSVPNTARLEAQRGGCCTVFPYFLGNILELPLTTTQDYALFHFLEDYSIELWKEQIQLITEKFGLMSFIVHPDYLLNEESRAVYRGLLSYLSELRRERRFWAALPREVNRWWRQRSRMTLARKDGRWAIEGEGSERARVGYARIAGDRIVFTVGQEQ